MEATQEQREAFGAGLADARKARRWSQTELGDAISDASQQKVSDWEKGKYAPSPQDACAAEELLDVEPGTLTRHLGFLPLAAAGRVLDCTVTDAILADPHLTGRRKRQLLGLYRELTS